MEQSLLPSAKHCSCHSSWLNRKPLLARPLPKRQIQTHVTSQLRRNAQPTQRPDKCLFGNASQAAPAVGHQRHQSKLRAKIRDSDTDDVVEGTRNPPNIFWRVAAAFMYIIPWIDVIALGREVYHHFPFSIWLFLFPGPFVGIYYSSQFAPLIVFFLLFLSVVKNTKLHHFVRFNAMQGIMLDIVVMLFSILRAYMPAEFRWSAILVTFDMYSWNICMGTILYCVFWTLWGRYADVPYVSDSVYMQVEASDPSAS